MIDIQNSYQINNFHYNNSTQTNPLLHHYQLNNKGELTNMPQGPMVPVAYQLALLTPCVTVSSSVISYFLSILA